MSTSALVLPSSTYPAKDYWKAYVFSCEDRFSFDCCTYCRRMTRGFNLFQSHSGRTTVPESVPARMSAAVRDWMLKKGRNLRSHAKNVFSCCEVNSEFVSDLLSTSNVAGYWDISSGLSVNPHLDLDSQLALVFQTLFGGREPVTDRNEISSQLNSLAFTPPAVMSRTNFNWTWLLQGAVGFGCINEPQALKALLSPTGAGFDRRFNSKILEVQEVVRPLDKFLEYCKPGLSGKLPLGLKAALLSKDRYTVSTFIVLLLAGDTNHPIPLWALDGIVELTNAINDMYTDLIGQADFDSDSDLTLAYEQELREGFTVQLYDLLWANAIGSATLPCELAYLRAKQELRAGRSSSGTEYIKVAHKSWGKVAWSDKKKWITIPVLPSESWVRQEPPHA